MKEQFVDNDVFIFRIDLKCNLLLNDVIVYVKPFPQPWDKNYDESKDTLSLEEKEDLVQEKYFTKERIDELKKKLVDRIMAEENPFYISCIDVDGGYDVTEEQLFQID